MLCGIQQNNSAMHIVNAQYIFFFTRIQFFYHPGFSTLAIFLKRTLDGSKWETYPLQPFSAFALTFCRRSPWLRGVIRKRAPHSLLTVSRAEGSTFAWQPKLARNACVFHRRRGDSPGFSLLVSNSGHLEVSIRLELPVSESCLEALVFSGQQERIPVLTRHPAEQERRSCSLRYEDRE